jgi:hypothetical protein
MKRIHIPNMGPDKNNVSTAIAIGIRECKAMDIKQMTLITTLKNLNNIIIGELLGDAASKKLMKGNSIPIDNYGINLTYESVSTVQKITTPQVGLAFYVSTKDIQKLDELYFDVLVFVPWLDTEGTNWAVKWNAETHGSSNQDTAINLSPGVVDSLKALTSCINLSTGIIHPSDKEHAKRKFSQLQLDGISWDIIEIEKWAVRNGWKASHAQELATLSSRYI